MTAHEVIDDYVGDVIRHLPRAMRDDVGFELRALLHDSLAERASAAGRPHDDAMVLALLRDFGAPRDVAVRYDPEGLVILRPGETRPFLRAGLAGVAIQWALTLPEAISTGSLGAWWLSWGLGAFWWPGALIMGSAAAAWLRQRGITRTARWPITIDRERVDSELTMFGLAAFVVGTTLVLFLPLLAQLLPPTGAPLFALAPEFLRWRAVPVLPLWALAFGVRLQALRHGRWSAPLRRWDVVIDLAFAVLLLWWSASGPVFLAAATDRAAKGVFGVIVLLILADLLRTFARRRPPIEPPAVTR